MNCNKKNQEIGPVTPPNRRYTGTALFFFTCVSSFLLSPSLPFDNFLAVANLFHFPAVPTNTILITPAAGGTTSESFVHPVFNESTSDNHEVAEIQGDDAKWPILIQILLISVVIIGAALKSCTVCQRCIRDSDAVDPEAGEPTVACYLCHKKVAASKWNDNETGHRKYCAVKSKEHRGKHTCNRRIRNAKCNNFLAPLPVLFQIY